MNDVVIAQQKSNNINTAEKSIFGIQTSSLGVWIHNEYKLSTQFLFKNNLGLESSFFENSSGFKFLLTIILTLKPR